MQSIMIIALYPMIHSSSIHSFFSLETVDPNFVWNGLKWVTTNYDPNWT